MSNQGFQSAMEALNDAYGREAKLQSQLDIAVEALSVAETCLSNLVQNKTMHVDYVKNSWMHVSEALAKIKGTIKHDRRNK